MVSLGKKVGPQGLLSTTNVGEVNRALILQTLSDNGPLARADLARMAGVTRGSIGGVVTGLLEEQILTELPTRTTRRRVGQPARPLWFGETGTFGAVVIQPGGALVAVVDSHGTIGTRVEVAMPNVEGPDDFDTLALTAVLNVLAPRRGELTAVGLALPSVFSASGEIIASTTIPALVGSRFPVLLAEALNTTVILEDDARALALGQRWFGQARGVPDFAALQIGEGIGAGIMVDGRLHRGTLMASEVGHMTVDLNGERCRCGLTGCWEAIASTHWLRVRAARSGLADADSIELDRLADLEAHGNQDAREVIDDFADHVAVGIVNLFHALAVPLFILHGPVVLAGDYFVARLRERVAARTLPGLTFVPKITFAENEADSAILGAAAVAVTYTLGVSM